jgi:hypothetical protein
MSRKPTSNPLADKLDRLGIAPKELAGVIRRPVDEVGDWYDGTAKPDADALVLLRFLDDDTDALRRVEQLRRTRTQTLEGDGARYAGIANVPYGTGDISKMTGGVSV